jgi:monoamine oxidase
MASDDAEVVVVGGGAAGIAAARRLVESNIRCLIVEARPRLGGRAFSVVSPDGHALDLGCGWLHSADRNPWSDIALKQGRRIDKTLPPWMRPSLPYGFSPAEQREFHKAANRFYQRLDHAEQAPDQPASNLLDPGSRWNGLIDAVNTFVSGAELDRVSARDLARYDASGHDWRVTEGYGTTIAAHGAGLPAALDCPVHRIDHSGARLRIETANGSFTADRAVVALPTPALSDPNFFHPALPEKTEAALGLPLGLDDKLFLALDHAEDFEADSRMFGRTDRAGTGSYHLRPFGRPQIEGYFGGSLAADLEAEGERGFFEFAAGELANLLGNSFRRRLRPIAVHCWGSDPFARGAYSYARPGQADQRAVLAASADQRLFFAGEACSLHDFSTAHGALLTGIAAAEQVIATRQR